MAQRKVKPEHVLLLLTLFFGGIFFIAHRSEGCERCDRGKRVMQRHASGERGFSIWDYAGVGQRAYEDQPMTYGSGSNSLDSASLTPAHFAPVWAEGPWLENASTCGGSYA